MEEQEVIFSFLCYDAAQPRQSAIPAVCYAQRTALPLILPFSFLAKISDQRTVDV